MKAMKIWDIIKEDFEKPSNLDEGWKNNAMAAVLAVSGLFGKAHAAGGHETPRVNAPQSLNKDSIRLNLSNVFTSGKYLFHSEDKDALESELKKFGLQIQKNPNTNIIIQIVSSESQVPNYDNETANHIKLGPWILAQRRAETAKFLISQFIEDLKKKSVFNGSVNFTNPDVKIGTAKWNPEIGKDNSVYTKDQYVQINIKFVPDDNAKKDTAVNFSAYADRGEVVHLGDQTWAMIFYPSRKTNSADNAGNLNTGQENVLLKTVKPNTALTGVKDEKGVYLGSYVIPSQWWNKNVSSNTLTPELIKVITGTPEWRQGN